jgi:hypothetical protein
MSTYNGDGPAQWKGDFDAFVGAVPRAATGVGLGVWSDGKGQWWEIVEGTRAKVAQAIAASSEGAQIKLSVLTTVPRDSSQHKAPARHGPGATTTGIKPTNIRNTT